jgi:thioredoxin-related protein
MKYTITVIACLLLHTISFSQNDSIPLYKKFPNIPPFSITKVPDSTKFAKADLKKNKEVLIMIFSPDCEHCQHETKELIKHMELFKKVQIVMCSPLDYKYLLKFYNEYQLYQYPNITIGRDDTYILGSFYNIHNFPSIFLYDKKGELVKDYDGSVPVEKIAESL